VLGYSGRLSTDADFSPDGHDPRVNGRLVVVGVVVIDAETGREEFRAPLVTYGYGRPTPADLDDDGDDEVFVRYGDGRVVALDYAT
jgi:hypothetical protein